MNINNKKIVITGAAGGFGRELTRQLCEKGALVDALDIDRQGLKTLKDKMTQLGYDIHTRHFDVTKKQDFQKYVTTLEHKKDYPDIWINNAGIAYPKAFVDTTEKTFEKILEVNLNGVILGTRIALKMMEKKGFGMIVNISSISGHIPTPFLSPYTTAKHAIVGFTRGLQLELEQMNSTIKLMLVSPGFADTNILKTNEEEFPFPKWLSWAIGTPESVTKDIVHGIERDKEEIFPTLCAPAFLRFYQFGPKFLYKMAAQLIAGKH